ncbi:XRE family transcriptional regulator [Streptomyces lunaelactis]|uniref:XRE family transcriptional regulator n=2 Tax=Streptomyces lunaelactis TaxID=1535768 RepID=UPI0020C81C1C|nr:XRE family transcriptional regulator [Streptomyces lunaelactis]
MGENRELAAALAESQMGQAELARRVNAEIEELTGQVGHVTDRDVRRWLTGETRWPQAKQRLCIGKVLGRSAIDLGFVPRSKNAPQAPPEDPVHRRAFIVAATGTAVAATAGASRSRLGQSDVHRFHAEHAEIIAQDQEVGGAQRVEHHAVELAMRIKSSLAGGAATSTWVRTKLYALASDVTCSAAFAAIDAQARTRARSHLDSAVTFAGLAGDSETQYHVWNHLAMVAGQRGDYAEVSAAADAAKSLSIAKKDPLYVSLAHMRSAHAHAGSRDRIAALRALTVAERTFGRHAAVDRPPWIQFYDEAELDGLTSIVWLRLGEPDRAEYHLHRALGAIHPDRIRNRTYYTAHLSLAQARQGDLALACSTGDRAAELLAKVRGSKRTTDTLANVRKLVVSSGSREPSVLDWAERAQAWT